jgi:putative spermidine/putrescine transport system substrate-binding protein
MKQELDLQRRQWLQKMGVLSAGSALGSLGLLQASSAFAQTGGNLVYAGFGGSYEQSIRAAVFDPFAAANNVKVLATTGGSDVAKATAMVRAKRTEWDLIDAQGATLAQFVAADLLQPLPKDLVDPKSLFNAQLITPYSIPWYQFSLNIYWNANAIKGELNSWADVWNVEKYPGKRGLSKLPWFSLEIALLADGVALDKLYPLDVDRAFASLDRIKKHAVFLDTSALANAISSQEVVAGIINLARLKSVQKAGVNVKYSWNQAMVEVQQLVVPKGAPNQKNAFDAIAYALHAEPQRRVLESLGYTPTLKSVLDGIDVAQAKDLPGTEYTRKNSFYLNTQWWGQHGAAVARRWQDWLANI